MKIGLTFWFPLPRVVAMCHATSYDFLKSIKPRAALCPLEANVWRAWNLASSHDILGTEFSSGQPLTRCQSWPTAHLQSHRSKVEASLSCTSTVTRRSWDYKCLKWTILGIRCYLIQIVVQWPVMLSILSGLCNCWRYLGCYKSFLHNLENLSSLPEPRAEGKNQHPRKFSSDFQRGTTTRVHPPSYSSNEQYSVNDTVL